MILHLENLERWNNNSYRSRSICLLILIIYGKKQQQPLCLKVKSQNFISFLPGCTGQANTTYQLYFYSISVILHGISLAPIYVRLSSSSIVCSNSMKALDFDYKNIYSDLTEYIWVVYLQLVLHLRIWLHSSSFGWIMIPNNYRS